MTIGVGCRTGPLREARAPAATQDAMIGEDPDAGLPSGRRTARIHSMTTTRFPH